MTVTFPPSIPFPELLREFQTWAEDKNTGQLGWFDFQPRRLDDLWIENGSALAEQFALFLHLPDGSTIGLWPQHSHDGQATHPVVLLGSEDQLAVLAPSLERFLWKWAEGELEVYDLNPEPEDDDDELNEKDDIPVDARPALKAWLQDRGVQPPISPDESGQPLQEFFDVWQKQQLARWAGNPTLQGLGELLKKHAPRRMEAWVPVSLQVKLTDAGLSITRSPLAPAEEATALQLLEHLREQMAQEYPGRGLWLTAEVQWYRDLGVTIRADYLTIPEQLGWATLQDTLNRFPRNEFWSIQRAD